ncbi:hypothetical protein H072_2000 [Dactylellina haptotyla CBS 200.50]|uniref:Cryptic loci regulator 2 N-terminal domain-containing protein n=1 Tax=Dactylellina haptotyla (strain CBS 200.50) TaxID=1284197 RepID=S8BWZ2_DACHA|nr:hypothetical protein H072_2000 [Dactylellina haptotyla CBS 200.50]
MAKDAEAPKWRILVFAGQSDGDSAARPTVQQLRPGTPTGSFVEISHNMVLDVLWRQRLGQLYMEKASPDDYAKHQHWVLEALPANYQLYAHKKPNTEELSAKKLASTGHFFGLKVGNNNVVFQSPEEFLPHLTWLGSDRSQSCTCHHCNKPRTSIPPQMQLSSYLTLMQADMNPAYGLYRPGEMVWANPNDTYPVISIIASRKMGGQEPAYELLPLKSPRVASRPPLVLPQSRLRPWLSYTPPDPLQPSIAARKYQVKWAEINWPEWTHQDAELHDASIIASIRIACNIGVTTCASETGENTIPCLWLGAEKIWRNGEVRVMTPEVEGQKGMDVLVIKNIIRDGGDGLFFQGNIYCKVLQHTAKATYPDPPPTPRMMADVTALQCRWHLKYQNVQINAMEIKGRWYPTSILRPIINPAAAPPDTAYYDVSSLLNNNTDIPNHGGGWRIGSSREEQILGIGHLPSNQPAGWINIEDWTRLYTDDVQQWTLLTSPAPALTPASVTIPAPVSALAPPAVAPPAPEQPAKTTKKPATRKTTTKRVSTKTKQAVTASEPVEEPVQEVKPHPPAPAPAPTAVEETQAAKQPPESYDENQDDNQDDFLRQIEQDGADFEKSVQESDPWGFYG